LVAEVALAGYSGELNREDRREQKGTQDSCPRAQHPVALEVQEGILGLVETNQPVEADTACHQMPAVVEDRQPACPMEAGSTRILALQDLREDHAGWVAPAEHWPVELEPM
jgi:hypothetical protein